MRIRSMDPDRIREWLPSSWMGWCVVWGLLVVAIVAAGALAGSILYPLFGTLLRMKLSVREMLVNGVFDGGFYALIWAPGGSFVACIMGAHWKNRNRAR